MSTLTYQNIHRTQIREPEDPSRLEIDRAALDNLADDLAVNGQLQPIGVRGPMPDGTYQLGFGHRRFLAAGLLGWTHIECKVWSPATDLYQMRASENHQREPLTPMEEAREIAAFLDRNEPVVSVARRYRKSGAWVEGRLALLQYPADIQESVHAGTLKLGVAAALAQVSHDAYRQQLIAEAQRSGCTASTAELWLQHWKVDGHRLQSNLATVEEIAQRRSAFIYYVPCDLCAAATDFGTTRALRTCPSCSAALDGVVARAAAEAAEATPAE